MAERGQYTLTEIKSQPETWAAAQETFRTQADAVRDLWNTGDFDSVLFTGCGSTYYLSRVAAWIYQEVLGLPCRAYPASEIVLMPDAVLTGSQKPLLVTLSRSGQTSETVEAARRFRTQTGQPVLTITCYPQSVLADEAALTLAIPAAQEESLAQTRSFTSMLLVAQAIAGMVAGQEIDWSRLRTVGASLLTQHEALARQLGEDDSIERFFFLGTGANYGLAAEAMLKMKEMSLSYSEAYHFLEFRHGPMAMVNANTLVAGLISDSGSSHEIAVLRQMRDQGARVLSITESDTAQLSEWSHVVPLNSGLPNWARSVLYLPVLQTMAYYRAMARGVNPDHPANLEAFVSLDNLTPDA